MNGLLVNIIHPDALWVRHQLIFPLSLVFRPLTLMFPVIHRDLLGLQAKRGIHSGRTVLITVAPQHKILLSLSVYADEPNFRATLASGGLETMWEGNHLRVTFIDPTEISVPCARSHSPQGFHCSRYTLFCDLPFYRLTFAISIIKERKAEPVLHVTALLPWYQKDRKTKTKN